MNEAHRRSTIGWPPIDDAVVSWGAKRHAADLHRMPIPEACARCTRDRAHRVRCACRLHVCRVAVLRSRSVLAHSSDIKASAPCRWWRRALPETATKHAGALLSLLRRRTSGRPRRRWLAGRAMERGRWYCRNHTARTPDRLPSTLGHLDKRRARGTPASRRGCTPDRARAREPVSVRRCARGRLLEHDRTPPPSAPPTSCADNADRCSRAPAPRSPAAARSARRWSRARRTALRTPLWPRRDRR